MLQILHAVLFRSVKQCSACVFPEIGFLFEILRMQKKQGHPMGTLKPFVSLKDEVTIMH